MTSPAWSGEYKGTGYGFNTNTDGKQYYGDSKFDESPKIEYIRNDNPEETAQHEIGHFLMMLVHRARHSERENFVNSAIKAMSKVKVHDIIKYVDGVGEGGYTMELIVSNEERKTPTYCYMLIAGMIGSWCSSLIKSDRENGKAEGKSLVDLVRSHLWTIRYIAKEKDENETFRLFKINGGRSDYKKLVRCIAGTDMTIDDLLWDAAELFGNEEFINMWGELSDRLMKKENLEFDAVDICDIAKEYKDRIYSVCEDVLKIENQKIEEEKRKQYRAEHPYRTKWNDFCEWIKKNKQECILWPSLAVGYLSYLCLLFFLS